MFNMDMVGWVRENALMVGGQSTAEGLADWLHLVAATLWVGGIVALVVGSFLNVVAYRLPAGKSVVTPRSACPAARPTRCRSRTKSSSQPSTAWSPWTTTT